DADASRLQQIIGNLISNANKFSDSGHRIELMLACHDGQAVIRVRDYGIGMTQQQLSRIFDLFMQVDTALEPSRSGLGLGLTLSSTLAERHGGEIEAHSAGLGHGSEFTLYLPVSDDVVPAPAPQPSAATRPAETPPRRMLIVDDNNAILDSMKL